jgi:hypothetical protein
MGSIFFQIFWKVDDLNGIKWAFLNANTTTNTQLFRNESKFHCWTNFDAKLPGLDDRATLFALLAALLGLALVLAHDRDTGQTLRHLRRLSLAAADAKWRPTEEGGILRSGGGVGGCGEEGGYHFGFGFGFGSVAAT